MPISATSFSKLRDDLLAQESYHNRRRIAIHTRHSNCVVNIIRSEERIISVTKS